MEVLLANLKDIPHNSYNIYSVLRCCFTLYFLHSLLLVFIIHSLHSSCFKVFLSDSECLLTPLETMKCTLLLIAMHLATSSFLLLVVRPGAPSSVLAPSSDALKSKRNLERTVPAPHLGLFRSEALLLLAHALAWRLPRSWWRWTWSWMMPVMRLWCRRRVLRRNPHMFQSLQLSAKAMVAGAEGLVSGHPPRTACTKALDFLAEGVVLKQEAYCSAYRAWCSQRTPWNRAKLHFSVKDLQLCPHHDHTMYMPR